MASVLTGIHGAAIKGGLAAVRLKFLRAVTAVEQYTLDDHWGQAWRIECLSTF